METQNIQQPSDDHRGKGALDAFFNLTYLVTLGWTAISFGGVIFQIINKYFGIGTYTYGYDSYYTSTLRFHLASLIIVMPIFLIITGILHKQYRENKLNFQSGIHRWLTYLMLFIAFCNIVGGLVAIVNGFLKGEFFSSFILKAITVMVIALGVFGYNFYDMKRKSFDSRSQISLISLVLVIILSVAAIVGAFVIMGSPLTARLYEFDNTRVYNLSNIRTQIQYYYDVNKKLKLPTALEINKRIEEIAKEGEYFVTERDETHNQLLVLRPLDKFTKDWNQKKAHWGNQVFNVAIGVWLD